MPDTTTTMLTTEVVVFRIDLLVSDDDGRAIKVSMLGADADSDDLLLTMIAAVDSDIAVGEHYRLTLEELL